MPIAAIHVTDKCMYVQCDESWPARLLGIYVRFSQPWLIRGGEFPDEGAGESTISLATRYCYCCAARWYVSWGHFVATLTVSHVEIRQWVPNAICVHHVGF